MNLNLSKFLLRSSLRGTIKPVKTETKEKSKRNPLNSGPDIDGYPRRIFDYTQLFVNLQHSISTKSLHEVSRHIEFEIETKNNKLSFIWLIVNIISDYQFY